MMKRRIGIIWVMVLAMLSMGMGASAMPVRIEGGTFSRTAVNVKDESTYALDTDQFQLIGTDREGMYIIFADQRYLKLSQAAIQQVLDAIDSDAVAALPSIQQYESLSRYSNGDAVAAMQTNLRALEYLSGSADGDFGGQSERAVTEFQAAMGLEQTGVADELLQMLLDSMIARRQDIRLGSAVSGGDSDDPYAIISGKTEANLEKAAELGLRLRYDDIAGEGMISNGAAISYTVPAASDIDQRAFTLNFGLSVRQDEDGVVIVEPVIRINCSGVQRPVMQEVILKSGDERHTLSVASLQNSLTGLRAVEEATVLLDEATVEMLANAADEGELKLRLGCKYNTYDITASSSNLESISQFGEAALGLYQ